MRFTCEHEPGEEQAALVSQACCQKTGEDRSSPALNCLSEHG